jgi:hypothetical protein
MSKKRKICKIGTCGDETFYNDCKFARGPNVKVDRINFGAELGQVDADGLNPPLVYKDSLFKRLWYWRLLQEKRPQFPNILLQDISIHITLTSVHTGQIGNLIGIAPWPGMMADGQNQIARAEILEHYQLPTPGGRRDLLAPLLTPMGLTFYLVRICDKNIAKKSEARIQPGDVLKSLEDLENHELPDHFEILAKHEAEISCDNTGCLLREHHLYMCYKFDKDESKVCLLPEEEEGDAIIYDTGNFALILVVNYMNGFYKARRLRGTLPQADQRYLNEVNTLYLGQQFSFGGGQTGLPVFFSDGAIEVAYKFNTNIENLTEIVRVVRNGLRNNNGNNGNNTMDDEIDL